MRELEPWLADDHGDDRELDADDEPGRRVLSWGGRAESPRIADLDFDPTGSAWGPQILRPSEPIHLRR